MIEETLDITTKDGEMETFICHPERNGPSAAVFLLMDAHGIREEVSSFTEFSRSSPGPPASAVRSRLRAYRHGYSGNHAESAPRRRTALRP